MVLVREISDDDWEVLRDIRLAALTDAPYAYESTYAVEAAFTEAAWRARIGQRSVTFFAYADLSNPADFDGTGGPGCPAAPDGLAGVFVEDGVADLVSMWVRPGARGLGVGEALVEAAASWAKGHGHETLFLWVTETNAPARRLYQRRGFTPTGERQPLSSETTLREIQLSRAL